MLKHLQIENYALIEKLVIDFSDGLTVISGETGAGKSILLGALSLILGNRADTQVLKEKNKKCIIEGSFLIKELALNDVFEKFDLDFDDCSIFRREITPQGKSRAFINDTPVTLQVMKAISEKLIDIHSQHESLLLGKSHFQFDVIDSYTQNLDNLIKYRSLFAEYKQLQKELHEIEESERAAKADLDYNRFQFEELENARLDPEEFARMEETISIQKNAEDILLKLKKTLFLLQEDDLNILDNISEIHALFKSLSGFGHKYNELAERLESVIIELKDIAGDAASLKEDIVHDPEQTAQLELRYDQINNLLLKHSVRDIESLLSIKESYRDKIDASISLEDNMLRVKQQISQMQSLLKLMANDISEKRAEAIPLIQKEILAMLKSLAMPHARFVIRQEKLDTNNINGIDSLSFLFNANPGGTLQDVSKVASGGELSRFMLSIKNMISEKKLLPTIIFDEIDTGISGETSTKVANILYDMSKNMQVIAITHLPQIASRGKNHLFVYKTVVNGKTQTQIKQLNNEDRVTELAKMLGGEKPTKKMFETAMELLLSGNRQVK